MTISLVGLLLLKYYKSLRAMLFYSKLEDHQYQEATDVYVVSGEGTS
jgi:hypothetical protein